MQHPSPLDILTQIAIHVPLWVWGVLALLIVIGRQQSRTQVVSRKRVMVLPLIWLVFGAWGVEKGFGQAGSAAAAMAAWALGLVASVGGMLAVGWPGGASYQTDSKHYVVPGSWLPLVVMLLIFVSRFAIGMALGFQPALSHSLPFAVAASLSYGLFSGFFLGRSINILRRGPSDRAAAVQVAG
ncbi:hypothetical protein OU995_13200 [Roseateles sp. SL47]|uniref:DUF6622 family protein n=1 Tax=Roseateles sp. SL47 TaxID=2995138 RepID=UPI0022712D8A|nr:DUF6622 family protein [Roseateles sp. SL47]WAC75592.1 hypothetical protein OU995_13200 [Roseateles sp. SL47]